jgi:hypothetical protein
MRIFLTFLILLNLSLAEDNKSQNVTEFEKILVEGEDDTSAFAMPNYIESQTYLPDAPGQQRLTSKEAMHLPGVQGDPIKAIKLLAGVTSTGSSGELVVHASKPRETLSTINQLPIGYLFHMGGLHSVIAPGAIEQLDIYLGGFDSTYNNAMGGVLDITPKYPMGDNAGFVHMGIFDASFGFDGKITDDLSIYVGARRSYFDLFIDEFVPKEEDEDNNVSVTITQFPRYYDATTLLSYVAGNHQISLENILARDEVALVIDGNVQDPEANGEIDSKQGFTTTGLRWQYNNYDNYQSNTLLYYMNSFANIELFNDLFVRIDSNELGLKHLSTYTQDKHKFSFGSYVQSFSVPLDINAPQQPSEEDINASFTQSDVYAIKETIRSDVLTLLAQDVYKASDDLTMRYGVNFITSTRKSLQNQLDPRTSIIYKTSPKDTLSLSVGQYSQTPQGSRLVSQGGNPDLTFENSKHYTVKYAHQFKEAHKIEIEPYYKSFEKLAITDTLENYVSAGDGDASGVDVTYKLRSENFYLLTTYTYTKAHRQISNDDESLYTFYGEIPHTLNVVGSYKINDKWNMSMLFKFQSGLPFTPVTGTTTATADDNSTYIVPIYGEAFSDRLNDYITLNFKVQYTEKYSRTSRIEYSFELMNLTNNVNEIGISYSDDYSKEIRRADLPFLPWFDVSYYF